MICRWGLDFKWVDEVRDVPGGIAEYAIARYASSFYDSLICGEWMTVTNELTSP
jgi:hypothetical protein